MKLSFSPSPSADSDSRSGRLAVAQVPLGALKVGFTTGYSSLMSEMHQRVAAIDAMCYALEAHLGMGCNVNMYLSPPSGSAFNPHFDWMDVVILQLSGSKEWRLYPPRMPLSSRMHATGRHQRVLHTATGVASLPAATVLTLAPGDSLYIPRGWIHEARTLPEVAHSLHITVGLFADGLDREGLLHIALDSLGADGIDRLTAGPACSAVPAPSRYRRRSGRGCEWGRGDGQPHANARRDGEAALAVWHAILRSVASAPSAVALRRMVPLWRMRGAADGGERALPRELNVTLSAAVRTFKAVAPRTRAAALSEACRWSGASAPETQTDEHSRLPPWVCETDASKARADLVIPSWASVEAALDEQWEGALESTFRAIDTFRSQLAEKQRKRLTTLGWHGAVPLRPREPRGPMAIPLGSTGLVGDSVSR